MTKKDKGQSKRFIEKAKELSADESEERFERALKMIAPPKGTVKSLEGNGHKKNL